ncbi:hypothetical protein AWC29_11930 [Mycobacterium triplex]|uniref:Uncharacterized protein n=1 Tax=Mycobacterium triplex TaxID=47839 RepID=A0ABX3W8C3_9MYCO|nr:hypothetical protein AWC29_11930 [Mycobacterium triplex]
MYCGNDLRDLRLHGFLGVLDLFDPLIALRGQIGQVMSQANDAVVGGAVCPLLSTIFFGHQPCLLFTPPEGVAEIVSGKSALVCEWPGLGDAQDISIL